MPVQSQQQFKWLAANRPDLLSKWQKESPRMFKSLPKRSPAKKKRRKRR